MVRTFRGVAASFAVVVAAAAPTAARAQTSWAAVMNGSQQVPPNSSTATGYTFLSLVGNMLTVNVTWSGITGGPLAAGHVHCCTTGPAAGNNVGVALPFAGLPATTAGSYTNTFDLLNTAVYEGAFLTANGGSATAARNALIAGLNGGQAYSNLHNAVYPGGEIRGNLAVVPEPGTYALLGTGLAGLAVVARRRRQRA